MSKVKVFIWPVNNSKGRELLNNYILPILNKYDTKLILPKSTDDRRKMFSGLNYSDLAILDGSVEDGHIYHKYNELPKVFSQVLLVSRTPLPINVYSLHEFAPKSPGGVNTNKEIGEWLSQLIPKIINNNRKSNRIIKKIFGNYFSMGSTLKEKERLLSIQVGSFISYRGTHINKAKQLKGKLDELRKQNCTLINPGDLAFETECLSAQRTWEVVSVIERKINAADEVFISLTEDFFESFWTMSELLALIYGRVKSKEKVGKTFIVIDGELESARPIKIDSEEIILPKHYGSIPLLTKQQEKRLGRIFSNSDPGTVAPDSQDVIIHNKKKGEIPDFIDSFNDRIYSETWRDDILVSCLYCRPKKRKVFDNFSWDDHLNIDGYGYFIVNSESIANSEQIVCPNCKKEIKLEKRLGLSGNQTPKVNCGLRT